MHLIEPFYHWLDLYNSETDAKSPLFDRHHSEVEFTHQIYNYLIHPQWDDIGSSTLFLRIIYCDYAKSYCIIELLGEWNDAINNDIMLLKRDIIDELSLQGINHFILIGENILNFHYSDECYYEEWFDDVNTNDGWIVFLNFRKHVLNEMQKCNIDQYVGIGGKFDTLEWRTYNPNQLFKKINSMMNKRLN